MDEAAKAFTLTSCNWFETAQTASCLAVPGKSLAVGLGECQTGFRSANQEEHDMYKTSAGLRFATVFVHVYRLLGMGGKLQYS